jgi:hypothetical protein
MSGEAHGLQSRRETACLIFAVGGEVQVSLPGVLTAERPGGFAVADEAGLHWDFSAILQPFHRGERAM